MKPLMPGGPGAAPNNRVPRSETEKLPVVHVVSAGSTKFKVSVVDGEHLPSALQNDPCAHVPHETPQRSPPRTLDHLRARRNARRDVRTPRSRNRSQGSSDVEVMQAPAGNVRVGG